MPKNKDDVALIYVGDGSVWRCPAGNVPPRDLTEEQAERYGGAKALAQSPLYRLPEKDSEVKDD